MYDNNYIYSVAYRIIYIELCQWLKFIIAVYINFSISIIL